MLCFPVARLLTRLVVPVDRSKLTAPELLAPAGDFEAMRAAVANGAGAVYFGLSDFNARHRATNFTIEELPQVMDYLHQHNVRGYVTFNTLIFSDELEQIAGLIVAAHRAGVDAVIVQDLGLTQLIGRTCPGLVIHGSTQMTLTEPRGIEFVKSLGVKRVILARELSASDIKKITAATDMPVEIFIHGALCVAYSGQCLTSEALGGRSANRGQCAQACRLPYDLIVDHKEFDLGDKSYLLSPQDLAAHDMVAELSEVGVCSFKIEGRLKSAQYVAAATQTYRAAIDAASVGKLFQISKQQEQELAQSFSRGFTHGFLDGVNHQSLVHARFPKSRGLKVGTVFDVEINHDSAFVIIDLIGDLKPGDGIVFDEGHPEQDEQGGRVFAVKPLGNHRVSVAFGRGNINPNAISPGAIVWKTDDPAVRRKLEQTYSRDDVVRRIPLDFSVSARVDGALVISARCRSDQHVSSFTWPGPLQIARKFPVTLEVLKEQLGRLGDTPFEIGNLDIDGELPAVMIPKSVLNDLRRSITDDLIEQRKTHTPTINENALSEIRTTITGLSAATDSPATLHILVRTLEQLQAAINYSGAVPVGTIYAEFEDVKKYKEAVQLARAAGKTIALATLRIIKPTEEGLLKSILSYEPDAILVRNLAGLSYYNEVSPQMPLIADYSLNIANEITASILARQKVLRMVPSYDLNWKQLSAMLSRFSARFFETVIHQHIPMFHMEHCVFCHTLSKGTDYTNCGRPCDTHQVDLRDRVGLNHPLIADVGCRNTVFNGQAQSAAEFIPRMKQLGLTNFRIELLRESAEEVAPLLDRYADVLTGKSEPRAAFRSLRVLNQLGVTAGTLEHE